MRRYLLGWAVLTLGMAVAALIGLLNFNGWARAVALIGDPALGGSAHGFWLGGSIVESSLWTLDTMVSIVAWTLIYKVRQRHAARLAQPTAVQSERL